MILGLFRNDFGMILKSFLDDSVMNLDSFWHDFGDFWIHLRYCVIFVARLCALND